MRGDIQTITVLGVPVACLTVDEALAEIERLHREDLASVVAFANAHALNLAIEDGGFRTILQHAALVLNDGSGLAIAARLQRRRFPANLNGSDLTPLLLDLAASKRWRVYLLGGAPGVAEAAREALVAVRPGLLVVGTGHGFFSPSEDDAVCGAVRESGADVVLVAMGNPRQERWLADNLAMTAAAVGVGVGAFFDFAADRVPRAPRWMNRLGVEWLFRLYQEPRRMWRRYVVGNPLFLWRAAREARRLRG